MSHFMLAQRDLRDLAKRLGSPRLTNEELRERLSDAYRTVFAANRGSGGRRDHYGVEVLSVVPETGAVELELVFKKAESYCCGEPGCHGGGFKRLRAEMEARGIGWLPALRVHVRGRAEPGAVFGARPRRAGRPSEGYEFEQEWYEHARGR